MLFRRLLPFITPIIVFGLFQLLFWYPRHLWFVLVGLVVVTFLPLYFIVDFSPTNQKSLFSYKKLKSQWQFFVIPLLFIIGFFGWELFLEGTFWKYLGAGLAAFFLGIYLENLFNYFLKTSQYQVYALEHISSYLSLASFFLLVLSSYGFIIFLNISPFYFTLLVFLVVFLLTYQIFWVNKIVLERFWIYLWVISLLIIEIFWSLLFLPHNFYLLAVFLTLIYYILINLSQHYLLGTFSLKILRHYLLSGVLFTLLLFVTARWR